MGLRSDRESDALAFGSAMHRALEHWYSLPMSERSLSQGLKEKAELFAYGHDLDVPAEEGALESIRQFAKCRYDVLKSLGEHDKRSLLNGIRILQAYFKRYADDGLEVLRDSQGPFIERDFEFVMVSTPALEIRYFGRIDVILRDTRTGDIYVADHKTTSQLGSEFYNRIKPNHQYTGYVMGAQRSMSINTSLFMVNGIQVAKTKQEFARQITPRNEDDFEQLIASVEECTLRYLNAYTRLEKLDYRLAYPMSAPNACAMYGGCQYLKIDELPIKMQDNAIRMLYPKAEE